MCWNLSKNGPKCPEIVEEARRRITIWQTPIIFPKTLKSCVSCPPLINFLGPSLRPLLCIPKKQLMKVCPIIYHQIILESTWLKKKFEKQPNNFVSEIWQTCPILSFAWINSFAIIMEWFSFELKLRVLSSQHNLSWISLFGSFKSQRIHQLWIVHYKGHIVNRNAVYGYGV